MRSAALAAGLAACTAHAWAAGAISASSSSPLVCYDDLSEPYFMQVEGKFAGLHVKLLSEAARRIGIAIEFRSLPIKRLESELARSDSGVTCAAGMARTARRAQFLDFGKVTLAATNYTVFVRSADKRVQGLDDLHGKTIGVRAGFPVPDAIAEGAAAGHWRLDEAASDTVNFKKLAMRRIDAVLSDKASGMAAVRARPDEVRMLALPAMRFDNYIGFAKSAQSAALALAFDEALDSMQQDGTLDKYLANYFGPAERKVAGVTKTYAAWNRGQVEKRLP